MILHLTNDYSGSTVYKNLIKELDSLGIGQIIYNPIREEKRVGRNQIELSILDSIFFYRKILNNNTDRIFYRNKVNKIVKDIEQVIDLTQVKLIHAHTWYSDGGVAYELNKKYMIPYIITVRNTDINLFLKFQIFDRAYGRKIIENAQKIISVSMVYKQRLLEDKRLRKVRDKLKKDIIVIPNGVDAFWIQNRVKSRKNIKDSEHIHLLYIGKFDKGKNVLNLVNAVINLNNTSPKFFLTLVGEGGNNDKDIRKKISKYNFIKHTGAIYDLQILKKYFQNADFFTMPSKAETFGLVYVESLLQGVPILYTENEGIDGFYDDSIGEKIKDTSVEEIESKIKKLALNNSLYDFDIDSIANNHNWKNIAAIFEKLYNLK